MPKCDRPASLWRRSRPSCQFASCGSVRPLKEDRLEGDDAMPSYMPTGIACCKSIPDDRTVLHGVEELRWDISVARAKCAGRFCGDGRFRCRRQRAEFAVCRSLDQPVGALSSADASHSVRCERQGRACSPVAGELPVQMPQQRNAHARSPRLKNSQKTANMPTISCKQPCQRVYHLDCAPPMHSGAGFMAGYICSGRVG